MADRFAPRFALEAGLLILLAVAAGFADLRPALIVLVMAIAWLIVSLIEWLAWRHNDLLVGELQVPKDEPGEGSALPGGRHGWDVEEILVPAEEVVAYSALDRGDALTTVLPAEADEADVVEAKPRRRWRRRSE